MTHKSYSNWTSINKLVNCSKALFGEEDCSKPTVPQNNEYWVDDSGQTLQSIDDRVNFLRLDIGQYGPGVIGFVWQQTDHNTEGHQCQGGKCRSATAESSSANLGFVSRRLTVTWLNLLIMHRFPCRLLLEGTTDIGATWCFWTPQKDLKQTSGYAKMTIVMGTTLRRISEWGSRHPEYLNRWCILASDRG